MSKNEYNFLINNPIQLNKAKYIKNIIIKNIDRGNYEMAEAKLDEYISMFPWDIEIQTIKSVICMQKNDFKTAKSILLKAIEVVPYNFDINYNLGYIYKIDKQYEESFKFYIRAMQVSQTEDEKAAISQALTDLTSECTKLDKSELIRTNNKLFPLRTNNEMWIGKPLLKDNNDEGYIPLYYDENLINYPINLWNFFKNEILHGKICHGQLLLKDIDEGNKVLPLAILNDNVGMKLISDGGEKIIRNLSPNRYYYIPLEENSINIEIKSNGSFIAGDLIDLKQKKKNEIKLVLNIFIDGLAQEAIDRVSLSELMPNTNTFFSKGTIFRNCFSNAEWTLPSIASINNGKFLHKHQIFHPEIIYDVNERGKIIPLYFKEKGYLTFQACGNWRKTPSYGYSNGYDRTIYQSATIGSNAEDIIFHFLEHMRAFEERDNAVWLSFFELHKVQDSITPKISSQVKNAENMWVNREENSKSVYLSYDSIKIRNYLNEIMRLDYYLNIIYKFIEDNFTDDEILVSLFSDHGVSYMDNEQFLLRNSRTKIPFMIRGRGIPQVISNELIEAVDILPSLLSKSSIDYEESSLDGKLPKTLGGSGKDYLFTESIYPGKTYKAAIRDENYYFTFESGGLVENDGRFFLGDYRTNLYKSNNMTDKPEINSEQTNLFTEIVLNKIKNLIRV